MAKINQIEFLPKRTQDHSKRLAIHLDNNQSYILKDHRGQATHLAIDIELTPDLLPFLELQSN